MLPGKSLTHPAYRADIDGLRAIAVLAVVGFHAFPHYFFSGFTGVDIFFVISGYLISSIIFNNLDQQSFSFTAFYRRRIRRIFPALIAVMLVSLLFGWFVPVPSEFKTLGHHVASSAAFYSNFVLWHEAGYFDHAALTKPLRHIWSLAIEEQFYIVWPLIVWLAARWRLRRQRICGVIIAASFLLSLYLIWHDHVADFYSPLSRFWELTLGSLLATHARFAPAASHADAKSWAGLLLILLGIFLPIPQNQFPGAWALLPTLGAYLLIAAGPATRVNRVLSNRVLVGVGLISYPLYLWHWPLLSFATIAGGNQSLTSHALLVLLSIMLAWLTYVLIEKPLRFGAYGNKKALALCAVMLALGAAGYYVDKRDGLPERFPPLLRDILGFQYDFDKEWRLDRCFIEPDSKTHGQYGDCTTRPARARNSVVLWGDSHAASLYPGLRKYLGATNQLTQFSAKGCPPILHYKGDVHPNCITLNDDVLHYIQKEKTHRVILVASWDQYDWQQVEDTVKQLRRAGVRKIDIVGVYPTWNGLLSQMMYNYYKANPTQPVPYRLSYQYVSAHTETENAMSDYAKKAGVRYLSATKIFCNADGCLARVGETADSITSWNNHHLTTKGAEYLVSHFPP